jgi:LysM repeat protein
LQSSLPVPQQAVETTEAPPAATATETIPPSTPLPTLTPSRTLRPPPTFEPPTATREATVTPSFTPTATLDLGVSIPGLRGAETPTPTTTAGCELREDWKLTYEVKRDDALAIIAQQYGTNVNELAEGNCLTDPNLIRVGQMLHVPGDLPPAQVYRCDTWEVLTPADGTMAIAGSGDLTFNWRGPRAPRSLIRIIKPDNVIYERVIEKRQNETIDLYEELPMAGTYTWYVFPLDENFVQLPCKEGGPWRFTKAAAPTPTPTPTPFPQVGP